MKKYEFKNCNLEINEDGQAVGLIFKDHEIKKYKTKKSIEKYKAYYYLIDTTKKGYKEKRLSAVFTKKHSLKEFYFDNLGKFYKGNIIKVGVDEEEKEIFKLVIDELGRNEYKTIKAELKELVKKGAINE